MRALPLAIAIVMASGAFVVAAGCGSNDCTETATCAETAEGGSGSGGDAKVAADSPGVETSSGSSSGGHDATTPFDAPSDAQMLPDVPFVDSSTCPTGSLCVDPAPSGWSGPVILYDATGTPLPVPPACPSTYPTQAYQGNAGLSGGNATCGCSCGTPMNANCNNSAVPVIAVYTTSDCSGTPCSDTLPYSAGGFCVGTGCSGGGSATVTQATGQNASCTASPSTNVPTAQWSEVGRVCAPPSVGGGCSGSQVCVPESPGMGFIAKACIVQTGPGPCPSGSSYSIQHTFYASTDDTRGCSPACTCANAQNVTCTGGAVSVYTVYGQMCGGTATNIPIDGACHPFTINGNIYAMDTSPSTPVAGTGSCAPSSPQPSGTLTATAPTTVCCAQ
jgi:hypothetical protein